MSPVAKYANQIEQDLRPVLKEWRRWTERYSEEVNREDALYWYNERTSAGNLAVAAARAGNYVLEEYRTPKAFESDKWTGRADLWIECGKRQYIAEVKHKLVSSKKGPQALSEFIDSWLGQACAEAACHPPVDDCQELGIVFVVPFLAAKEHSGRGDYIELFKKTIESMSLDAHAFAFPKYGGPVNDSGRLHPGVACCVRALEPRLGRRPKSRAWRR